MRDSGKNKYSALQHKHLLAWGLNFGLAWPKMISAAIKCHSKLQKQAHSYLKCTTGSEHIRTRVVYLHVSRPPHLKSSAQPNRHRTKMLRTLQRKPQQALNKHQLREEKGWLPPCTPTSCFICQVIRWHRWNSWLFTCLRWFPRKSSANYLCRDFN